MVVTGGVLMGKLLASLDQTIVGTALPRIVAELNGLATHAWVGTAYLVASATSRSPDGWATCSAARSSSLSSSRASSAS